MKKSAPRARIFFALGGLAQARLVRLATRRELRGFIAACCQPFWTGFAPWSPSVVVVAFRRDTAGRPFFSRRHQPEK
jgi:hypothetical protein